MPSLLELLEAAGGRRRGEPDVNPAAPAGVLESVKAEGSRRRHRRHRRNVAIGGAFVVLAAIPAVALGAFGGGDDDESVEVAAATADERDGRDDAPAITTTTEAPAVLPTETTLPTEVAGVQITRPQTSPTTRPTATTVPLVCQNSTNPACGEFSWNPAPAANQELLLDGPDEPVTVVAGETVTVVVAWSDGDASLVSHVFSPDGALVGGGCQTEQRFGAWTPPTQRPGNGVLTYDYTAPADAGGTVVKVGLSAATSAAEDFGCQDPYRSEATLLIDVIIEPAPAP